MSKKRKDDKKIDPVKRRSTKSYLVPASYLLFIVLLTLGGLIYWNQKPKTLDVYPSTLSQNWRLEKIAKDHQIEGYVSDDSVNPGATLGFQVSCRSGSYQTDIYRMGWANGNGASLMASLDSRGCQRQNIPAPERTTGLVSPEWPTSFRLHIPNNWAPGVYLAKLTGADGFQNYIPFMVRSPQPSSKYLFVHSINTDEAYNFWGGNSLYSGYTPALKVKRAVKVSLNRPFTMPNSNGDGSGNFLTWEYPMIKFLEQYNYKVDYATDIDVHQNPKILLKYKSIIITGHDEYWSKQMRDGYQAAVDHGVNLAIFAANTAYRPVRFEPDPFTGQPDRVIVDYKSADLDPLSKNPATKAFSTPYSWRLKPLNRPESELIGSAYRNETSDEGKNSGDLAVNNEQSWVLAGTGLHNGDLIPGLVGYEYDQLTDSLPHPPNVDAVFHSPIKSIYHNHKDYADATYYQKLNGGQVFDAGTLQWSWGLDSGRSVYSPELVQITRNILDRFGL